MTDMKSGLKVMIAIAIMTGTVLVAGCGSSDKMTKTTTTEQSTTTATPVAPTASTTTTTTTQQSRP